MLDGETVVARIGDQIEVGGGSSDREAGVGGCPVTPPVFLGYLFERPDESEQPSRDASPVPPADPAGTEITYEHRTLGWISDAGGRGRDLYADERGA